MNLDYWSSANRPAFEIGEEVHLKRGGSVEAIIERKLAGGKWMYRTTTNFGRHSLHWLAESILSPF